LIHSRRAFSDVYFFRRRHLRACRRCEPLFTPYERARCPCRHATMPLTPTRHFRHALPNHRVGASHCFSPKILRWRIYADYFRHDIAASTRRLADVYAAFIFHARMLRCLHVRCQPAAAGGIALCRFSFIWLSLASSLRHAAGAFRFRHVIAAMPPALKPFFCCASAAARWRCAASAHAADGDADTSIVEFLSNIATPSRSRSAFFTPGFRHTAPCPLPVEFAATVHIYFPTPEDFLLRAAAADADTRRVISDITFSPRYAFHRCSSMIREKEGHAFALLMRSVSRHCADFRHARLSIFSSISLSQLSSLCYAPSRYASFDLILYCLMLPAAITPLVC